MTDVTAPAAAPAAPLATSATLAEPTAPAESTTPNLGGHVTDRTANTMAEALVARGVWTAEQAAAALADPDADPGALPAPTAQSDLATITSMKASLEGQGFETKAIDGAAHIINRGLANPPSEAAKHEAAAICMESLRSQYGDKTDYIVEAARRELSMLAQQQPGLRDLLERSGAGNNLWIIQGLAGRHLDRLKKAHLGG
ncbi:hypothetical protein LRK24_10230 [Rhodanobacter denitrificans]|uniref:hypothetical protein n=1 Tax=Rhodanobacter denitrificans TaxID=666685 RepID=UPI000A5BB875|nr:hypothetical protein [Rhodanobacter denitrificans]UJM88839.1 hypothetical protein LRK24_10230 [Rhodanobacter denitrificans]